MEQKIIAVEISLIRIFCSLFDTEFEYFFKKYKLTANIAAGGRQNLISKYNPTIMLPVLKPWTALNKKRRKINHMQSIIAAMVFFSIGLCSISSN